MNNGKEEILDELRQAIEEYLSRNPNLSVQSVSDRSGVGYNTVRRIMNRQSLPELTQVIKILGAISQENRLAKLINLYGGKLKQTLEKAFSTYQSCTPNHVFSLDVDKHLSDELSFIVYSLAANACGTTEEQIIRVCGEPGLESCRRLMSLELMTKDLSGVIRAKQSYFTLSIESIKKSLSYFAKYYNTSHAGKKRSHALTMTESINIEGLRKLHEINAKHAKEVTEILHGKQYTGNIPVFSVAFMDSFVDELPGVDDEN